MLRGGAVRRAVAAHHVQQTIAKARPLIAGFAERFETEPQGGIGV